MEGLFILPHPTAKRPSSRVSFLPLPHEGLNLFSIFEFHVVITSPRTSKQFWTLMAVASCSAFCRDKAVLRFTPHAPINFTHFGIRELSKIELYMFLFPLNCRCPRQDLCSLVANIIFSYQLTLSVCKAPSGNLLTPLCPQLKSPG